MGQLQETAGAKAQGVLGTIWSLAPSWGQRGATQGELTLMPQFNPYLRKEANHCSRHSPYAQGVGVLEARGPRHERTGAFRNSEDTILTTLLTG